MIEILNEAKQIDIVLYCSVVGLFTTLSWLSVLIVGEIIGRSFRFITRDSEIFPNVIIFPVYKFLCSIRGMGITWNSARFRIFNAKTGDYAGYTDYVDAAMFQWVVISFALFLIGFFHILLSYLWPLWVALGLYLAILFLARYVVDMNKVMKSHINDKKIHN